MFVCVRESMCVCKSACRVSACVCVQKCVRESVRM